MRRNPTIKTFTEHWKSLSARNDATNPEVPKILKNLHIMKWTVSFCDFARQVIGTRTILLSYVIRETVTVPALTALLMVEQTYTDELVLVEGELIYRATHTHLLYRDDNAFLYFYMEEATCSTMYTTLIQPYSWCKDGYGAWFEIKNQYARYDKWGAELKKQDNLLHT